jgi:L-lactate dehydrogenase (cytochrome)
LKGILRADDARRARDAGYDAVWVTSHGARQLESAVAPIDALPSIRRALGDEAEIIYDGGVMRGVDVVKAIARGATAVGVGKAYLYGLAAGGVRGVERAFDFLTSETKRAMALIGVKNIDELRARGDDVVRERRR